jgi:hypothetical protein
MPPLGGTSAQTCHESSYGTTNDGPRNATQVAGVSQPRGNLHLGLMGFDQKPLPASQFSALGGQVSRADPFALPKSQSFLDSGRTR